MDGESKNAVANRIGIGEMTLDSHRTVLVIMVLEGDGPMDVIGGNP